MGLSPQDEFRQADLLIQRLRVEGKLGPLRAVLARLVPAVRAMNLGDTSDFPVGEDVAEREMFHLLDDLGCLAVLNRPEQDGTVMYELFSKRQLAYLAENVDADSSRPES